MFEQLKFSWGHIIAFVAIILISYVTFVGDTYLTDGDFSHATMVMAGVDLLLLLWCLIAQYAKGHYTSFRSLDSGGTFFRVYSSLGIYHSYDDCLFALLDGA